MMEKIKRIYRKLFKNPPKAKVDLKLKTERKGSVYGGWNIVANSLDKNSVVYSFGIGKDISFDLSVIERYNCNVFGFDPTPEVNDWLAAQSLPGEFVFRPIGISSEDGELTFYTPKNPNNISHTAHKSENSIAVVVQCQKLSTIMKSLGHDKIDLLKMDIEGFEYSVLRDFIEEGVFPNQILVEFHHFFPKWSNQDTENAIQYLKDNGYQLFNVADSFCEYSFVKQN